MTVKRRNHGKNRKGRGSVPFVRCTNCSRAVPKDKCVRRMLVRNMIESAGQRDIIEASVYDVFVIPKMYIKLTYCISCALHARVVRARPAKDRKNREPPRRPRRRRDDDNKKKPYGTQNNEAAESAIAAALAAKAAAATATEGAAEAVTETAAAEAPVEA
ncbi:30S ribosomal protein S26e [Thecamonas trahens ATCC 50062]|uniref:40S ribosomal protein S26 n=1 Tax=Thecamonas trahens ATCC 50062 TaxID=461836 RepID=A0A0L0DT63_THETB|nr:30S ribosomal protein S26e [Thecamonas trahens ATCC 50062]KNC54623.1 30S ribosomal protein S26e [Thecamonas trahens ATCC 50062]|eukprot:XP_013761530.1 30S ribosomal protein S26e [Thecamonas trahens ATCC 50062]